MIIKILTCYLLYKEYCKRDAKKHLKYKLLKINVLVVWNNGGVK